ncbi:MAG: hypothetical protein V2I66_01375 [Halieaceae bacterium]|jgi:hypothetical protein|nr:hypothetical protein [Halieaceae bacterium]
MSRPILAALLAVLVSACASEPEAPAAPEQKLVLPTPLMKDFSGHWEMDYGRSDNVDRKLRSLYREMQRNAQRVARGDQRSRIMSPELVNASFGKVVDMARMADMITDSQVLDIEQSADDIEIRRENNFTLTCVFNDGQPELVIDELGSEICGWDAQQLLFRIALPDGLDILHRVSMSEDRQRLHVATTVNRRGASPFTLNRFYFRFDPLPEDYECEYTLSRGNVCQTGGL